jgi:hypothetical protein
LKAQIEGVNMTILILGIVICLSLIVYFYVCNLNASVFPKMGFINDEIPIGRVELEKHFSFDYFGGQKNEEG